VIGSAEGAAQVADEPQGPVGGLVRTGRRVGVVPDGGDRPAVRGRDVARRLEPAEEGQTSVNDALKRPRRRPNTKQHAIRASASIPATPAAWLLLRAGK